MDWESVLRPEDGHNQLLRSSTRPPEWVNPRPAARYNLVVIGGGTAGLVAAAGAAGLGAKVALVERALLGGDCLNVGCVPSKALLRSGRAAADMRDAARWGIRLAAEAKVDFPTVMERMRQLRAQLSPHDSANRFRNLGVDVFFGEAQFCGRQMVDVGGARLSFSKAVIATGTRPATPPIPGLDQVPFLTNETIFSLTELPSRLAVIGAGPIGCELAQAFARFGSRVHLIETAHGVLPNDDPDASAVVKQSLERDGIDVLCCGQNLRVSRTPTSCELSVDSHGTSWRLTVDQLLVATGRQANVEKLDLETAGVHCDRSGISVNDRLQTSNPRIYAAGDVCSRYRFTHAADAMSRIVLQNALFGGRNRISKAVIPWCTYTDPELAQVGLSEKVAAEQGIAVRTFVQSFSEVDRSVLDGEAEGFVKVLVPRRGDRILGATVVSRHAGTLLGEVTLAITAKLGLKTIAKTIHPYPTQADAIKKIADAYNRTRLTPLVQDLFGKWLAWTR